MSGGEQQMLAIGRALMARPRLLLPRRALDGAGAQADPADLRHHHRDLQPGHHDPGGRAEREAGALAGAPRLRPRDRQDRQDRQGQRPRSTTPASARPTSASPDARAEPSAQCRAAATPTSSGATSSAGSRSATGISRIRSSRSATPTSSSPPTAVIAARWASGRTSPSASPTSVRLPWTTSDGERARGDPPAERGGERDRGEPVEGRLEQELVRAVAQAVVERAQDRQRPAAEDQRRDHEALDEPGPLGGRRSHPRAGAAASRRGPRSGTPAAAASPTIPPISSEPSTISMGALSRPRRAAPGTGPRSPRSRRSAA